MNRCRENRVALLLLTSLLVAGCFSSNAVRESYLERSAFMHERRTRPVIVIPGFGHSRLFDPELDRYVWGTGRAMMTARFPDDFDLPVDPRTGVATPDRLVARGFIGSRGPTNASWHLCEALRKFGGYDRCVQEPRGAGRVNAYAFAWDWRLSHIENAHRLDDYIEVIRSEHGDATLRVDLVTHSAGGVVAMALARFGRSRLDDDRATIDRAGAIAQRKLGRIVMLAPPLRGTLESFRLLNQTEKFARRTLTPSTSVTFPSVPELFPADGKVFVDTAGATTSDDLWEVETWKRRKFGVFSSHDVPAVTEELFRLHLARGRRFRELIEQPGPTGSISVVAGGCVPTSARIALRDDQSFVLYPSQLRPEEAALRSILFQPGDGSILVSSTRLQGEPSIVCDGHQGIALDPTVYLLILRALKDR